MVHLSGGSIAISRKSYGLSFPLSLVQMQISEPIVVDSGFGIVLSGCSKLSCFVNSREKLVASKIQLN